MTNHTLNIYVFAVQIGHGFLATDNHMDQNHNSIVCRHALQYPILKPQSHYEYLYISVKNYHNTTQSTLVYGRIIFQLIQLINIPLSVLIFQILNSNPRHGIN